MFRETISSDETGLLIAEQTDPRKVPSDAATVWRVMEPNSYGSFGPSTKLVARSPINANRQNKKGTVVGLDATADGIEQDITPVNFAEDMQGFMFADIRYKNRIRSSAATNTGYTVASGGDAYKANDIVFAEGSTVTNNNGMKVVGAGSTGTNVAVTGLGVVGGQNVTLYRVGHVFAAGDLSIDASGALPKLVSAAADLSALGLIIGEWLFIGGDGAGTSFAQGVNNGFARIIAITANALTFDKTEAPMVADDGAGKTVQLFFGNVLKNEPPELIKTRNYCLRRRLGRPDDASPVVQSEVIIGAVANEVTITVPEEDKLTAEFSYMAREWAAYGDDSDIDGIEVQPAEADAYNSTGDAVRARMAVYSRVASAPMPLFGIFTDFTITINNNVSANKAVTRFGAAAMTPGKFEVSGSFNAYFATVEAVNAVKQNKDVTFDFIEVRENKGMVVDIPLVALSTEGVELEANSPAMLSVDASAGTARKINEGLDHTLLFVFFPFLPDVAATK